MTKNDMALIRGGTGSGSGVVQSEFDQDLAYYDEATSFIATEQADLSWVVANYISDQVAEVADALKGDVEGVLKDDVNIDTDLSAIGEDRVNIDTNEAVQAYYLVQMELLSK